MHVLTCVEVLCVSRACIRVVEVCVCVCACVSCRDRDACTPGINEISITQEWYRSPRGT
jgi:hypothetical protein